MTEEEKHTEVMTKLQDLNTKFEELIKPAITQTYINKTDILKLYFFQYIIKYVCGFVILLLVFITSCSFWEWYKKH